ncbi:MAG: hypothetical protein NVS2B6_06900 [Thermoleophilaceae bacterium]
MPLSRAELAGRVEALAGMPTLLAALGGLPPAYLVGGAVRDLLRGARAVDRDVAIEGDAADAAKTLARRLGGEARFHERFGTATVIAPVLQLDIAMARRERYAAPGALPDVQPATLEEDLARRDFTINAMAIGLSGADLGHLQDPHGGREDLERGVIRVLHDGSFSDDPTRLLRALRYAARLEGSLEGHTAGLAREAIAAGTPATVAGVRIRDELLDLLAEPNAPAALELMRELGLDRALDPALAVDPEHAASAALGAAETGADPVLAALAALLVGAVDSLEPWIEDLNLGRGARDRVLRAARNAPMLAVMLRRELAPSQLYDLLASEPPEALALALGLGAPAEPILTYLRDLRDTRLEVTGHDLLEAGVPAAAPLGDALAETLRQKLDGRVAGRGEELALALRLARGGGR